MIGSTLIEHKANALFLFLPIKTGLFQVERVLPTPEQCQIVAWCQGVIGKHLSIQKNHISMDENRTSGIYPDELII